MGLNTRGGAGSSNVTYLNVYQGNLVLEYNKEDDLEKKLEGLGLDVDKIRERKRTKGKYEGQSVFYYVLFDVSGLMTNVKFNETSFGDFLEVEFTDVDEKFAVSLGDVTSRMAKDFTRRVGGLDLNKEVVFGVWSISAEDADNGKAKSGVRMYQDGKKIDYHISYDDLPEPTQAKKGRKTVWDYSEQEQYLFEALEEFQSDNFKGDPTVTVPSKLTMKTPSTASEVTAQPTTSNVDDLPF